MPLQHAKLSDIKTLLSTPNLIYANPASTKTYIRELVLHNTGSSAETVKIYNVPDNNGTLGTTSSLNRFANVSIAVNETLFLAFEFPIVLTDLNDALLAESTTNNSVTVQILGDKE